MNLTTSQKAQMYDDLIYQSDLLNRENNKLKSEYVTNIPPNIQKIIGENNIKISNLVNRLETLIS